jgi:hypothetical protein
LPCKRDIEAAIAAYNDTNDRKSTLPPTSGELLAVMFPQDDVCQRSLRSLQANGLDRNAVTRLLRALVSAGFLSKDRGRKGLTPTYHLHLTPRGQL